MPRREFDGLILALDVATVLGWCRGRPSADPESGFLRLGPRGATITEKCIALEAWLRSQIRAHKPDRVVIEAPPPIGGFKGQTTGKTLLDLNLLCSTVERVCAELKIDCRQVRSQTWKKYVCGFTLGVNKSTVPYPVFAALEQRGFVVTDHNEADAIGIWLRSFSKGAPTAAARFDPLARRVAARGGRVRVQ